LRDGIALGPIAKKLTSTRMQVTKGWLKEHSPPVFWRFATELLCLRSA